MTREYWCGREPADRTISESLGIAPGTPVAVIRRTRLADRRPIAFCLSFLPDWVFDIGVDLHEYGGSIFNYLETRKGYVIRSAMSKIVATTPGTYVSNKLDIPESSCILLLNQVFYDKNGRGVMYSRDHFNPAFIDFIVYRVR